MNAKAAFEPKSAGANYQGVWDHRIGFGRKAALVMVDFVQAYTTPESPLYAEMVVTAVTNSVALLDQARRSGVPVIHTTMSFQKSGFFNGGMWLKKAPVLACLAEPELGRFCPEVLPTPDEVVVPKQYASAFFGTSLASMLTAAGVDTIVITGCSTSGCIRATAVDGVQHGFRVIVPEECVGDRHIEPHKANLFDINSKYGDVVSRQEVLTYFQSLESLQDVALQG